MWLGAVETDMQETLKRCTKSALLGYYEEGAKREEWALHGGHPAQCILSVSSIAWTQRVEEALEILNLAASSQSTSSSAGAAATAAAAAAEGDQLPAAPILATNPLEEVFTFWCGQLKQLTTQVSLPLSQQS